MMKVYKPGSAAYNRQKETQRNQLAADRRGRPQPGKKGQKYLYPERHKGRT